MNYTPNTLRASGLIGLGLITLGLITLGTTASAASIANGGFEAGLNGWTAAGDASVATAAFGSGPSAGANQALLTNALNADDDLSGTNYNASGNAPVEVGGAGGLEEQLGLAIGALDALLAAAPTEGSGLVQTFTADTGSRIAFDWNFLSNDTSAADFAFVAVDGIVRLLADSLSATLIASGSPFGGETGFKTFVSDPFTSSGLHRLAVGVLDLNDYVNSSALLIDDVRGVPAPAGIWLIAAGLFGYLGAACSGRRPSEGGTAGAASPVIARRARRSRL